MSAYSIFRLDKNDPAYSFGKRYRVLWNDEPIQAYYTKHEAIADIRWREKRKAEIATTRTGAEDDRRGR